MKKEINITGTDPKAIDLLRQIYSALKDKQPEKLQMIEKFWIDGIENEFNNTKQEDRITENLISVLKELLENNRSNIISNKNFNEIIEQIIIARDGNDYAKQEFSKIESVIFHLMELNFKTSTELSASFIKKRQNIFQYFQTVLYMLSDKLQRSVVSNKIIDTLAAQSEYDATIVTDEQGNIRFADSKAQNLFCNKIIRKDKCDPNYNCTYNINQCLGIGAKKRNYANTMLRMIISGSNPSISTETIITSKGKRKSVIKATLSNNDPTEITEILFQIQLLTT